jgi:PEP-CTERM motif
MKYRMWTALPLIAGLSLAGSAQALTFNFSFGGDGNVTSFGTITVGPDSHADTSGIFGTLANQKSVSSGNPAFTYQGLVDPANALAVTGISGMFSDAALGIAAATITGLVMTNPQAHHDSDYTIPYSFGWYPGLPAGPVVSYDNLFYPGGAAPITCIGVPPGGFFDDYGVMFTLSDGAIVDFFSNGGNSPGIYGAVVWAAGDPSPDYTSAGGLSLTAPEPSTWAMMLLGFAGLAFAGYRKSRKTVTAAA